LSGKEVGSEIRYDHVSSPPFSSFFSLLPPFPSMVAIEEIIGVTLASVFLPHFPLFFPFSPSRWLGHGGEDREEAGMAGLGRFLSFFTPLFRGGTAVRTSISTFTPLSHSFPPLNFFFLRAAGIALVGDMW